MAWSAICVSRMHVRTFVSVPVLSEHSSDTEPSVSTVASDLQRMLLFFMEYAVIVRHVARAIGRPSGMKATATLTQSTMRSGTSIHSGYDFRSQAALWWSHSTFYPVRQGGGAAYQRATTSTTTKNTSPQITVTNLIISFCSGVIPLRGRLDNFAILPKTVLSPVSTTIPMPLPLTQWVPCNAIQRVSR